MWLTIVERFCDHADVRVRVRGDDHSGINVGNSKLGKSTVQSRQYVGKKVEQQGSGVCVALHRWLQVDLKLLLS